MKFYWFEDKLIRFYLRAKFQNPNITEHDLGSDSYKKLHAINRCLSSDPQDMLHDISNHVPHHFNVKTKNPYVYRKETRSFGEICLDTASKISQQTDRPIAVLWSGGIDSTAALVALMQTIDRKRLTVVCTQDSINEFPSFYENKIKNRVATMSPPDLHQRYQEFYSVGGDGGDTVWGVIDDSFWAKDQHKLHAPWHDCLDPSIMSDHDFVEEFCSWSKVKITTWLELRIWFYLCCKWQSKCMRVYWLRQDLIDDDTVAFYDIDSSFQCWTMNNLDQIIGLRWEDYKVPAKKFIYSYHADQDYLKNKSKENSKGLEQSLKSKHAYQNHVRIAVAEDFTGPRLSSWPFFDYAEFEDFNDEWELIPKQLLM